MQSNALSSGWLEIGSARPPKKEHECVGNVLGESWYPGTTRRTAKRADVTPQNSKNERNVKGRGGQYGVIPEDVHVVADQLHAGPIASPVPIILRPRLHPHSVSRVQSLFTDTIKYKVV